MRRYITYLFIATTFLAIIIGINGVKVVLMNYQEEQSQQQDVTEETSVYYNSSFSTHLPLVVIETGNEQIKKESKTWAEITVIHPPYTNNDLNDTLDFTTTALINYRGSSSYKTFDKKQYHIEFHDGYDKEKKKSYPVMGMGADSDWVLNGPFLDRSLVRNQLIYSISREILPWAPDTQYCEVFLNGEYQGLYLMVEPITNGENRLNLNNFGLVSGQTAYILKRDRENTEENEFYSYGNINGKTSNPFSIIYPKPSRITKQQYQWIEKDINDFERVLYSDYFDNQDYGYAAYIDVQSFVDYYIINELTLTTDASYLSTYVYKDMGGKLKATVWDFNNSFNNYPWEPKSSNQFHVAQNNWYSRLFQDKNFTKMVVERYKELRKGSLSEENLLKLVDENILYLGDAIYRNFEIWGYTFNEGLLSKDEQGNNRDPRSYEEAIQQLKKSIVERGDFLDEYIETLFQYAIN
ncbi:MAG: CotH kinase family protein [Vulcanibacillus sp.]